MTLMSLNSACVSQVPTPIAPPLAGNSIAGGVEIHVQHHVAAGLGEHLLDVVGGCAAHAAVVVLDRVGIPLPPVRR